MATAQVKVEPTILKWVLQVSAYRLGQTDKEQIAEWIAGEKVPTLRQLGKLSKRAGVPFGYFFLSTVPNEDLPVLKFRAINNERIIQPSRELIDQINDIEIKQSWLRDERKNAGFGINGFNGGFKRLATRKDDYEGIAKDIATYLEISPNWNAEIKETNHFNYLRAALDQAGVTTISGSYVKSNTHRPLNPAEFRAFALADEFAPFIFVNTNDSYNAQLFSLTHELVHLWFGNSETYNDDYESTLSVSEQAINRIAECFLFPTKVFTTKWQENDPLDDVERISTLAKIFGASKLSVAIRAVHLGLTGQQSVVAIKKSYQKQPKDEKKNTGGPSYYRLVVSHLGKPFINAVERGAKEERISYTKAFELLNTGNQSTYDGILKEAR